jgi:soluble lytic murein transglycosylase-like protein
MILERQCLGRPRRAPALALGAGLLALSGAALANPGGGCGSCGGGGDSGMSAQEASQKAGEAARDAANRGQATTLTVNNGGRRNEDLSGSIAELGATVNAGPEDLRGQVGSLAAKYDLDPALLDALVRQVSGWKADAVGPGGARGPAQLMPATASMLGVDPNDPASNLEGGARYLRMLLDRFDGDVRKAVAAYYAGPGSVAKAGGVPPNYETRKFVDSVMAQLAHEGIPPAR